MKNETLLILAVVLATAVEMVEALTIVLAVGVTRGWRATLIGVGAALVTLAIVVAALGPAITHLSLTPLRLFVGGLLLIFGIQWTRKAILRSSGYKALHDEEAIFDSTRGSAVEMPRGASSTATPSPSPSKASSSRVSKWSSSSSPSGPHNIGSRSVPWLRC